MLHPRSFSHFNAVAKVAAIQMNSAADWVKNRDTAEKLIAQAVDQGAELVALPEYFPIISADKKARFVLAEDDGCGPMQDFLAEQAQKYGIWLVGGSLPLKSYVADKLTNSCLVYGPNGARVVRYDKVHLFSFQKGEERYDESATQIAGNQPVSFDTPFGRIGLGICYDLRFPELFRQLNAIDLLILPAAFTVPTGQAHWALLLRARAVENLCYVLAPAQVGLHENGRKTYGHSMLIDPWGDVLACLPEGEGVVMDELKAARLQEVRLQLPALAHRRW
ncbi:MAG TPA: carbon-nitrogen hydrolase family protein [Marinospirillum sp.]|uniref:carbon-nitrogen hydrolase family protein n=1 Tax=Marinospirillum sp. TaxID=2183934 RepID=UPI002B45DC1F|nr:carbon-nitrogen hydrolase family protein [Marinospirillum sp.]HKM15270.1 carbon-nitrogen hydrolase family protein [Marinospirillum sp.]